MTDTYDLYALDGTYLRSVEYDNPPPVLLWQQRCFVLSSRIGSAYNELEYAVLPEVWGMPEEPRP